jgi:hypothetical protein
MKAHLGRLPGEGSLGGQVKALFRREDLRGRVWPRKIIDLSLSLGQNICKVEFGQRQ